MIVQATRISRKGGVQYLASHLLDKSDENDRIEILAGDRAALYDAQALAEVKSCRYSVRHLSISPEREMSPAQLSAFIRAIDAEFRVGPDRPRLVVRHVKKDRSHFHVVLAEVDPTTLRVLDCRNDFRRLEDLARRYEADHGENVQPTRVERREARIEGFSDVARKRAERMSPGFDRTRLKCAFAIGAEAFQLELKTQGLRLADGDKGAILVTAEGTFVAAACRAVGIKRGEFRKFEQRGNDNEQLIGTQTPAPATAGECRAQHNEAPTAPKSAGNAGWTGPRRPVAGTVAARPRYATSSGRGFEGGFRQGRSVVTALTVRRCREDLSLSRLNRELDDILRRAQELASWIRSIFEPESIRLSRQIEDIRRMRKSFPPAEASRPSASDYDYRRRVTP